MPERLPTVVLPVFNSVTGLDASLASLERTLPPGTEVLIADDASSDPHVEPLARGWCYRSQLAATYVRRDARLGFARNLDAAIGESGDADVVVLQSGAVATAGWLQQLARRAGQPGRLATLVTWSNRSGLCSFPRFDDDNPPPDFPEPIAEAATAMADDAGPELPSVAGPCLFLRRAALRELGGLDPVSFPGLGVLDDFARRAAAMGWSNRLCPSAFVVNLLGSADGQAPADDPGRLQSRWPDYQEQLARFILADPLRELRHRLQARIELLAASGPQRDLFH